VAGREPVRINPADAKSRGIAEGDIVRLFNERGSCLAGAVITTAVRPGVIELSTGAWYDPVDPGLESSLDSHGSVNVLTHDHGTSRLAQGPAAHSALVEIEKYTGALPQISIDKPPRFATRPATAA
jgi:biotin/methionine sulfoxide reductase